jgi:hypothetical protein
MKNIITLDGEDYPRDPDYDYTKRDILQFHFDEKATTLTPEELAKEQFYNTPCKNLLVARKKAEAIIALCDLHDVPKE